MDPREAGGIKRELGGGTVVVVDSDLDVESEGRSKRVVLVASMPSTLKLVAIPCRRWGVGKTRLTISTNKFREKSRGRVYSSRRKTSSLSVTMSSAEHNFSGALATWKGVTHILVFVRFSQPSRYPAINLHELQKTLDAQGVEVVENQKENVLSRKSLSERTKGQCGSILLEHWRCSSMATPTSRPRRPFAYIHGLQNSRRFLMMRKSTLSRGSLKVDLEFHHTLFQF